VFKRIGVKQKLYIALVSIFSLGLFWQYFGGLANAAQLTSTSVRFTRMKAATATTFRVTFTVPVGNSATEAKLKIAFPDGYTVATSNLTADSSSCGTTGLPGTLTVAGNNTNGTKNITVSGVTNLTASTSYCVDIDRTTTNDPITNAAAGTYQIGVTTQDSTPTDIDTATIASNTINDDQILVSATVPTSFTFVIDNNSTSFTSNLSTGSVVQTTQRTATITTNATAGWIAWAKDSQTGLHSTIASKTISATTPGTGATLSNGTEGYVLGVDAVDAASGGAVSVVGAYAGTGADADGSGLDTTYRQIASSNGTANGDVLQLHGKAAISGTTPAATDYSDTWTVIGAGSF
jgi:hypothetical protein